MHKIIYLLLIIPFLSLSQQKAFPTAYGGGAYASGGRVGNVYHVTSLSDDDTVGTFRWALSQPRPSTIVFDVSGIINLLTPLQINGNDLTISGQTAPMGGITLTYPAEGKISYGDAQNIIMRYIRVRPQYQGDTALSIFPGNSEGDEASNLMFDHISISYAGLQGFSMRGKETKNITFQHGLIAESKTGSLFGDTDTANFSYNNTFRTTMFYNVGQRTPNTSSGRADVYNNVVYQWINRLTTVKVNSHINHFNNYYFLGSRTSLWYQYQSNPRMWFVNGATNEHPEFPFSIYTKGNIVQDLFTDPEADNQYLWIEHAYSSQTERVDSSFFTDIKFPMIGAVPEEMTAVEASIAVPPDSGAYKFLNADGSVGIYRDPQDTRYVNNVINDTPEFFDNYGYGESGSYHSASEEQPYFDFLAAISTTPINTRPDNFYVSNPHIPEIWFQANVPTGQDHNDIAPSGYTWLEEYLNGVDASSVSIGVESIAVTPNPAELQITDTLQLTATFTPTNATNQSGTWTSSDESIATVDSNGLVTPISIGEVIITFTTDDGNFIDTSEITVFPEALNPSAGDDQQICEGESTILNASGGTNYVWSTGETADSIEVTPDTTTTYTVTVSDDNGQSEDANITVTVNAIPIADAGEDQSICEGSSTTLTATGGASYLWSTGETTASIEVSPTEETIYTVEVSDNNCSSSDSVTIFVNAAPEIIISEDIVIFEGESTTLTVSGSDTYEWSTGETTESITVTPVITTTYTVSSIGPNGCLSNEEVTVIVIPEIIANAGEDEIICSGETVTLTALGGSNYTWNTGDLGPELTVSPIETTTYTVTVEDDYGNTDTDEITVFVNDAPSITVNDDVFIMIGSSVTLTANGGSTYSWNTGETTSEISVSPGVTTTYTVTGFSENGCQSIEEVIVNVVEELIANAGEDTTICLGESVTLNASGGISYTWNTGETGASPTFTPTENTTYTVTVTDGFGNSDTDDVTITVNPVPIASAGEDQTLCQSESAVLTAEGGDTYLWSTGETTDTIVVNPNIDTIYTVEAFTGSCSDTDEVSVFVLPTPELTVSDDIVIVIGNSTSLEVSGANSYLWSTGEISNSIVVNPTETTTYAVTGYSESGCESTGEVTVTVIPEINADAGNDTSICNGESVTLTASGGINYSWSTGETSASIIVNPTETETYTVTVSDTFGSSDSDSLTVTVNDLPIITLSQDVTIFEGESTNLTVNGASSYLWNTGETTSTIFVSPLETTTYSVTGYSDSGCESTGEVTVTVIPEINADAGNDTSICNGESVTLTASGGINYSWSTGETSASIIVNPTETETYTVTVSDNFGSSDSDSVTVTVNELPIISVSENITIIEGESTSLFVDGAETYLWNTGATSSSISVSPTQTTTYNVIGITNTCSSEQKEVTVTVTPLFIASAGTDERVCDNQNYEVVLTANEGDSYLWNTGETTQSIVVSPLSTATYSVTVTLGEQTATDDVKVYVDPSPDVVIANGDSVDILNGDFVTLSVSGANTYEWNNGASQPNIAVSPSTTTTYEVKGFIGQCYDDKQVTVNVLQPVVADAGEDVLICLDDLTTLTASGGDDYVWSTGETTPTITVSPIETTDYTVTVFNALDFDEATVRVEVDANCAVDSINPIEDEETELEFDIYPNPASGIVNVKISGTLNVSDINIYDVTGKLIKHSKITNENLSYTTTTQIGISTLQSGVYFVKLIEEDRVITKKLIVE